MQLVFDPDFDLGAWPGPRAGAAAVAGRAWVGPEGFLGILETQLGLAVPHASQADAVASLVPRLFQQDRFFGASARVDPWATGLRLLQWRDRLWEHGWRGEGLGQPRLVELAEVTLGLPPGRAQRLELVGGWLESKKTDIEEVELFVPPEALSPAWRQILRALSKSGARIVHSALGETEARGNLGALRARRATIDPTDRSLQSVQVNGTREAARIVAAALAADPGFGETVLVAPDGLLDEALAELGLPSVGAESAHRTSALSELLPMTIGLAWGPIDPQLAHDWLSLPETPLSKNFARDLLVTLQKWPAVDNPDWRARVALGLKDEPDATRIVRTVFEAQAERSHELRVRDLLPRIALVQEWAQRKAPTSSSHEEVLEQCLTLRRRFALAELARLSGPALEAVLASVVGRGGAARQLPMAGYASVGRPGGIAGAIRRTIWWGFLGAGSPRQHGVVLRSQERDALASIGVVIPTLGEELRHQAVRSLRPLYQTTESLILISPRHDEAGELAHPHPVWDELVSRLRDPRDARYLIVDSPILGTPIARGPVSRRTPLSPSRAQRASFPIATRPTESPTSLSKLIGCSFAYAAEYVGRVRSRHLPWPIVDNRLFGQLAHEVFAQLAMADGLVRDNVGVAALSLLSKLLPSHGALLLLPGHQQELVQLREAIAGTAELLARIISSDRLRVHAVETELSAKFASSSLIGTPDLVLADEDRRLVLLDLKWSGESYRRDELRAGTALQLSAYARLLEEAGAKVRTLGYVVLRSHRVLLRGEKLSFAQVLRPDLLDDTWSAVLRGWQQRTAELSRGELFAEGVAALDHEPIENASLIAGNLSLPAPCGFCGLDLLCGRSSGHS